MAVAHGAGQACYRTPGSPTCGDCRCYQAAKRRRLMADPAYRARALAKKRDRDGDRYATDPIFRMKRDLIDRRHRARRRAERRPT